MYSIITSLLSLPLTISTAFAAGTGPGPVVPTTLNEPITSDVTFTGPLGNATITDVIDRIINYAILVAGPLAAIMILWGAFQILTSRGSEEKYKAGRKTIIYALAGLGIVILARGLVAIFRGLILGLGA